MVQILLLVQQEVNGNGSILVGRVLVFGPSLANGHVCRLELAWLLCFVISPSNATLAWNDCSFIPRLLSFPLILSTLFIFHRMRVCCSLLASDFMPPSMFLFISLFLLLFFHQLSLAHTFSLPYILLFVHPEAIFRKSYFLQ